MKTYISKKAIRNNLLYTMKFIIEDNGLLLKLINKVLEHYENDILWEEYFKFHHTKFKHKIMHKYEHILEREHLYDVVLGEE